MTKRKLTRREFLKLAGAGAAVTAPLALGGGAYFYRNALGEVPRERSPYVEITHTASLDGSVPLLLIVDKTSANPFGMYFTEILRAEGLNCFHTADLSTLQPESLQRYEAAILTESSLTPQQVEIFANYVARGGRLVGMRPAEGLESVFGVERSAGVFLEGYLKTDSAHPAAAGIQSSSLQIHGESHLFTLREAQPVAWLYADRDTPTENPAITLNGFGEGLAVAYAFDLAKCIALMRQGNPKLIDQDNDGLPGIRTVDKFAGWIDLERIHIPQADELQRLFVNLLMQLSRTPLPRFWYFPEDKKCVLIATGDSHMNPANFIEDVLSRVEARGGHFTVYYAPQIVSDIGRAERLARFWVTDNIPLASDVLGKEFGSPTPLMVDGWRARGHEIALHPYVDTELEGGWLEYWKEFTGRGYAPVPHTVRTHRVLWSGWTETARWQATLGIRMNCDYYHVGPSLQKKNGEWPNGHLTGSGRPMKFVDEHGRILDIYQQLTQFADEHLIPMDVPGWGGWPQLTAQQAVAAAADLLDRSLHGDYSAICGQFHVDPFQVGGEPAEKAGIFLEGTLDFARERGIPILSAQEWLRFTDLRHDADFTSLVWDAAASALTFHLLPPNQPDSTLTVLLPIRHAEKTLASVNVDDVTTTLDKRLVLGGVEYALVIVSAQEHVIRAGYL
ncbi:MAG: twin-arginine translocation signal domain-containing protein [Anaerolineales bacterium]|nr:twin-arginine translocation signal domain-containing protein [Anaerolineales bacterium]NUQ83853.1 twin-arginine translocation signal domain-containing protein [Anaerolineales bacterium]